MADSKFDPFRFEASPKLSMKRLAILILQNIFKKGNDFPQSLLGEWAGFPVKGQGTRIYLFFRIFRLANPSRRRGS